MILWANLNFNGIIFLTILIASLRRCIYMRAGPLGET
jgi:hypothetical protein